MGSCPECGATRSTYTRPFECEECGAFWPALRLRGGDA